MARKIAIFGGTFDPVHLGHVQLAVALKEAHGLDAILVIPANRSPHKKNEVPQEAKHRVNMLRKAFKDLSYCKVLTLEVRRPGPSYTIDTVHELIAKKVVLPGDRLYLIIGEDSLKGLHSWKNIDELMQHTAPLVARRTGSLAVKQPKLQKWLKPGITNTPYFEVSATDVRKRLKSKLYCGHLLSNNVYKYIQHHKLYV